jgi:hypothetical protein
MGHQPPKAEVGCSNHLGCANHIIGLSASPALLENPLPALSPRNMFAGRSRERRPVNERAGSAARRPSLGEADVPASFPVRSSLDGRNEGAKRLIFLCMSHSVPPYCRFYRHQWTCRCGRHKGREELAMRKSLALLMEERGKHANYWENPDCHCRARDRGGRRRPGTGQAGRLRAA